MSRKGLLYSSLQTGNCFLRSLVHDGSPEWVADRLFGHTSHKDRTGDRSGLAPRRRCFQWSCGRRCRDLYGFKEIFLWLHTRSFRGRSLLLVVCLPFLSRSEKTEESLRPSRSLGRCFGWSILRRRSIGRHIDSSFLILLSTCIRCERPWTVSFPM